MSFSVFIIYKVLAFLRENYKLALAYEGAQLQDVLVSSWTLLHV